MATVGFYPACLASCCVGGSLLSSLLACFDEDTTVITLQGKISLSKVKAGDLVMTTTLGG